MTGTGNTQKTVLIGLTLSVIVAMGSLFITSTESSGDTNWDDTTFETQTTGSMDPGNVQIDLTPAMSGDTLVVETALNTHTEDLAQHDLMEQTSLEVDGTVNAPTAAPTLSGHHPSGTMVFDLDEPPETFTITITGIPAEPERVYEW